MSGFGGEVRGDEIVSGVGAESVRDEPRSARYEAVEHHQPTCERPSQHHADEHADLEAAYLGEYIESVAGVGPVDLKGALHNGDLVLHLPVGSARSSSRRLTRRSASQGCNYGAGGRSVADAHVAGADDVGPVVRSLQCETDARSHAGNGLIASHGGTLRDVGGPTSDGDYP